MTTPSTTRHTPDRSHTENYFFANPSHGGGLPYRYILDRSLIEFIVPTPPPIPMRRPHPHFLTTPPRKSNCTMGEIALNLPTWAQYFGLLDEAEMETPENMRFMDADITPRINYLNGTLALLGSQDRVTGFNCPAVANSVLALMADDTVPQQYKFILICMKLMHLENIVAMKSKDVRFNRGFLKDMVKLMKDLKDDDTTKQELENSTKVTQHLQTAHASVMWENVNLKEQLRIREEMHHAIWQKHTMQNANPTQVEAEVERLQSNNQYNYSKTTKDKVLFEKINKVQKGYNDKKAELDTALQVAENNLKRAQKAAADAKAWGIHLDFLKSKTVEKETTRAKTPRVTQPIIDESEEVTLAFNHLAIDAAASSTALTAYDPEELGLAFSNLAISKYYDVD